jgi:hypothetical protein
MCKRISKFDARSSILKCTVRRTGEPPAEQGLNKLKARDNIIDNKENEARGKGKVTSKQPKQSKYDGVDNKSNVVNEVSLTNHGKTGEKRIGMVFAIL